MCILYKHQGGLQSLQLGYGIGLRHKLLDESQELPPFGALLVVYPLEDFQSFLVAG